MQREGWRHTTDELLDKCLHAVCLQSRPNDIVDESVVRQSAAYGLDALARRARFQKNRIEEGACALAERVFKFVDQARGRDKVAVETRWHMLYGELDEGIEFEEPELQRKEMQHFAKPYVATPALQAGDRDPKLELLLRHLGLALHLSFEGFRIGFITYAVNGRRNLCPTGPIGGKPNVRGWMRL